MTHDEKIVWKYFEHAAVDYHYNGIGAVIWVKDHIQTRSYEVIRLAYERLSPFEKNQILLWLGKYCSEMTKKAGQKACAK